MAVRGRGGRGGLVGGRGGAIPEREAEARVGAPSRSPSPRGSRSDEGTVASTSGEGGIESEEVVEPVFGADPPSEGEVEEAKEEVKAPVLALRQQKVKRKKTPVGDGEDVLDKVWKDLDGEVIDEECVEREFTNEKKANKSGEWDCQSQKLFLTYPSHIPKDALKAAMTKAASGQLKGKPKFWRAAHETGDKICPYLHTHVLIDWGIAFRWRDVRLFDWVWKDEGMWEGLDPDVPIQKGGRRAHPNIRVVGRRNLDFARCKWYLGKEDPENVDLKGNPSIVLAIQKCESEHEALVKHCKTPAQARGVIDIYERRKEPSKAKVIKPKLWQKELLAMFDVSSGTESSEGLVPDDGVEWIPGHYEKKVIDGVKKKVWVEATGVPKVTGMGGSGKDRRIISIYDPTGGTGKTKLGMSLARSDPVKYLYLPGTGNAKDMATVIKGALKRGWSGEVLFVDVTRQKADQTALYEVLEMMRNGSMMTLKWDGSVFDWKSGYLVVMTNWMPDLARMSQDRWEIFTIKNNFTLRWVSLEEAAEIRAGEAGERKAAADPRRQ